MLEVGIRTLKARLSELVRRAAEGETIVVTDRGHPVAALVPHGNTKIPPELAERARRGEVILATRPPVRTKPRGRLKPGVSLSDILIEQRRHERLLR